MNQILLLCFLGGLFLLVDAGFLTVTRKPEYIGGPVPDLYDTPFAAANVSGVVMGYSANGETKLISMGPTIDSLLPIPQSINLGKGNSSSDLDYCGAWLNAAQYEEETGIVRGFYHEEWRCDYARNSYTNKSIAYAESRDGGKTFVKVGYPDNAIILPPEGNTTTVHQTGEGDHGVVRIGDYYYLYFKEWDSQGVPTGLARSAVKDGGVPGTWWKYYNGNFSEPGRGGRSTAFAGIKGTSVHIRKHHRDVLMAQLTGTGIELTRSSDGINWEEPSPPLFPYTPSSWDRSGNPGELVAYVGLACTWRH